MFRILTDPPGNTSGSAVAGIAKLGYVNEKSLIFVLFFFFQLQAEFKFLNCSEKVPGEGEGHRCLGEVVRLLPLASLLRLVLPSFFLGYV